MNAVVEWIKRNWNEESNVGKAKLAAVTALVFLLIASLLPDRGHEPALVSPAADAADVTGTGPEAARQAAEAYASYEARVGELERETQAATDQAAAAYASYEARVAELERERTELIAKQEEAGSLEDASAEVAETIRAYEARILELEDEKRALAAEMAKLEAGGEAARQAAEAYASYEARVGELERETRIGAGEAARTYASYEARVAELESELAARERRIVELERRLASGGEDGGAANQELRLQLEAMRATLDQVLKRLEQ